MTSTYTVLVIFALGLRFIYFKPKRIRLNVLDAAFVVFYAWHIFSASYMANATVSAEAAGSFALSAGSVYAAARLAAMSGDHSARVKEFVIGMGLMGLVFGAMLAASGQVVYGRLRLEDASTVGMAQSFALATTAGLGMLFVGSRQHKYVATGFAGLVAVVGVYVTLLSGTRGNLLAVSAAVLFVLVVLNKKVAGRMLGVACAAILVASLADFGAVQESMARILDFGSYGAESDISSRIRVEYLWAAFDMIQKSPIIGSGVGSYNYTTGFIYPHNFFAEVWAESGIIGVMAFVIVLWAATHRVFKSKIISDGWGVVVVMLVVTAFVQHQVSLPAADAKGLFLMGFFAGYPLISERGMGREHRVSVAAGISARKLPASSAG